MIETNNLSPVKGLKTIHMANIWEIVAVVIAAAGGAILAVVKPMGGDLEQLKADNNIAMLAILAFATVLALVSTVLIFVSLVIKLVGLVKLFKIHAGYKTAMLLVSLSLVLSLIVPVLPIDNLIISAVTRVLNLLYIASVYFIIGTTVGFLRNQGHEALAATGLRVRVLYVCCNVVSVAVNLLALLPALALVVGVITLVTSAIQLVALFKYIVFLRRTTTALEG